MRGLQLFRERFEGFEDCYVVIGGAASDLVMDDAGLGFRATKDLDIVLCIEALTVEFIDAFWSFIHDGGYRSKEKADGRREHYRFHSPSQEQYPAMLELFTRQPDAIRIPDGVHLTPVPTTSDLSSLSAILMDETYYRWVVDGRVRLQGVPIVGAIHLIPLKARAWIELSRRRESGQQVDSGDIKKQRNDVVRLAQTLRSVAISGVPTAVREDMRVFSERLLLDGVDPKSFGVTAFRDSGEVVRLLRVVYSIDQP